MELFVTPSSLIFCIVVHLVRRAEWSHFLNDLVLLFAESEAHVGGAKIVKALGDKGNLVQAANLVALRLPGSEMLGEGNGPSSSRLLADTPELREGLDSIDGGLIDPEGGNR